MRKSSIKYWFPHGYSAVTYESLLIHRIAWQQQQRITALFKPSKKQYFTLLFGDA